LRAYYAFMWAYPGKKLLFMGQEFAQASEWNHDESLPWDQSKDAAGLATKSLIYDLNQLYRSYSALHELDNDPRGFEWLIQDDASNQVLAWARKDLACVTPQSKHGQMIMVVCNFSDRDLHAYRIGVPADMQTVQWKEILNTHRAAYQTPISRYAPTSVLRTVQTDRFPANGKEQSVQLQCRAFSVSYFVAQPLE
jgi:1,4-alpha-glucan branching enzyme